MQFYRHEHSPARRSAERVYNLLDYLRIAAAMMCSAQLRLSVNRGQFLRNVYTGMEKTADLMRITFR